MYWQLDNQFEYRIHGFVSQLLVFHEGSGATHLLAEDSRRVFNLFFEQPAMKFNVEDINANLPAVENLKSLLEQLSRLHLIVRVSDDAAGYSSIT